MFSYQGVALDVGMQYTQVVQRSFHISMATLEPGDGGGSGDGDGEGEVSVMIQHDSSDFALCTLQPHIRPQQALDLDFHCGEHVTFYLHGNSTLMAVCCEDARSINYRKLRLFLRTLTLRIWAFYIEMH